MASPPFSVIERPTTSQHHSKPAELVVPVRVVAVDMVDAAKTGRITVFGRTKLTDDPAERPKTRVLGIFRYIGGGCIGLVKRPTILGRPSEISSLKAVIFREARAAAKAAYTRH